MSTKITADNGVEFEVCSLGVAVVNHEEQTETWARLSPEQRRALADALAPERDCSGVDWKTMYEHEVRNRVEAVDRAARAERERGEWKAGGQEWQLLAKQERARAEQAERELAALRGRVEDIIPGTEVIHAAWNGQGIGRIKHERELGVQCLIRDRVLAAIEAEAVVDPVEAKARVEADRRYSGDPNHAFIEGAVWAARHLNEADQ